MNSTTSRSEKREPVGRQDASRRPVSSLLACLLVAVALHAAGAAWAWSVYFLGTAHRQLADRAPELSGQTLTVRLSGGAVDPQVFRATTTHGLSVQVAAGETCPQAGRAHAPDARGMGTGLFDVHVGALQSTGANGRRASASSLCPAHR